MSSLGGGGAAGGRGRNERDGATTDVDDEGVGGASWGGVEERRLLIFQFCWRFSAGDRNYTRALGGGSSCTRDAFRRTFRRAC